ncbi:MAG TPA: hypothetical protein VFZ61_24660 [Polyangiales bacterium]
MAGRASSGSGLLPCDVADVLKRRCQSCHASSPVAGVPMALVTREDLLAPAVTRGELTVAQLTGARVHDAQRPMPPNQLLPAEELAILDAWLQRGTPAGTDPSCAPATGGDAGVGPPPDTTCYTLNAHGQPVAGDRSPWMVKNQHYACFYFDTPWPEGAQGVYFAPVFDQHPSLVHHFLLYLDQDGNKADGFVETCSGLHDSGPTMVAGWAPGSDNNDLPPDVGLDLSPPNRKLLLEIHFYHDGKSEAVATTSGIKICTANKNRPNTATVSMLGTERISLPANAKSSTSGICTPQYKGDIHILRSWPHMHQMGIGMKTIVTRKDGTTETLGEWPFDFNSQVSYKTPLVIKPGDRLTTTCEYHNTANRTVSVGTATDSEMCFNFVTAYPPLALTSRNIFGGSTSLTSSASACLE